jgi:hypothetical protein
LQDYRSGSVITAVICLQMKQRQFSLSTLVIAVLVCSVLIWLGSNLIRGVLRSRKLSADAQFVHSVKKSVGGFPLYMLLTKEAASQFEPESGNSE